MGLGNVVTVMKNFGVSKNKKNDKKTTVFKLINQDNSQIDKISEFSYQKFKNTKEWDLKKALTNFVGEPIYDDYMSPDKIYIRASGLYYLCPREQTLKSVLKLKTERKIDVKGNLIFALGSMFHKWVQNEIFDDYIAGIWVCKNCKTSYGEAENLSFKPSVCEKCGGEEFEYEEVHLYKDELKLGGHPDGFILTNDNKLEIIDFKTAATELYDGVEKFGISDGYKWQANGYMLLSRVEQVRLIFINKNVPVFKEKIVKQDEEIIKGIIHKCNETIRGVSSVESDKIYLPARDMCDSKTSSRAKNCPLADICFLYGKEADEINRKSINKG